MAQFSNRRNKIFHDKLLELTKECRTAAEYKTRLQKATAFSHTNNEVAKKK